MPKTMELAMVGLGRMGGNMAERLLRGGHRVVATDRSPEAVQKLVSLGAVGAATLPDAVAKLSAPRAVWLMIPAGKPVDDTIAALAGLLGPGDTIIDGGNSNYRETIRRGKEVAARGMHYVDCGTSGGIWGLENGYSMMVGGAKEAVDRLRPIFETLAPGPQTGWGHVGPSGAGHFVKMVHNGIEYGMMQAFAEGFAIMAKKADLNLNCSQIAEIWRNGSVVRSWLLDLAARALSENPTLDGIKPWVSDSGEGRWTVQEAIDLDVSAPVITQSLFERFRSRDANSYADRILAVLREQFGGHGVKRG
ncbi:MAG: 6-phosphogluconate dehydrogenase, NAD(+)-dependent, decarboxylating [Phycisphaerales bacterium]|nr:6-phosphogluconate dehydrogenase, NAD(+)-dependent, decarboxylating [Phycisphaerales bacterium]